MESQVHHLEQEAYSSVLRAFLAQSDSISWDQLELITHLRRELRVSDGEHKELYSQVKDDEIIQRIKDWRHGGRNRATTLSTSHYVDDSGPTLSGPTSYKKQKTSHSGPSYKLGTPLLGLQPHSHSAAQQEALSGGRGRIHKPGQPFRNSSSVKSLQPHSTGPAVNGRFTNHGSSGVPITNELAEAATSDDPLVGRKVCTRWPEDNSFYEAVITDYNPSEGRHALVYDINTVHETWEWVDLKEISPNDIRWVGEDPGISRRAGPGAQGHGVNKFLSPSDGGGPAFGRRRGSTTIQSRKEFPSSQNGIQRKVSDDIEIVNTDTLIKEVERIFSASNPDPLEIDKAKKMLKEHEEALVNAITKLADTSDGESDGERTLSLGQSVGRGGAPRNLALGEGADERHGDGKNASAVQQDDEYIEGI